LKKYFDYGIHSFDVFYYSEDLTAPQSIIPNSSLFHMQWCSGKFGTGGMLGSPLPLISSLFLYSPLSSPNLHSLPLLSSLFP